MSELVELLQYSALATALRQSLWLYPLINTAHILGIALLFGSVVPLDLRLLGAWPSIPLVTINHLLFPVTVVGFFLALISGLLLFITQAENYFSSITFLYKIGIFVAALLNTAVNIFSRHWQQAITEN